VAREKRGLAMALCVAVLRPPMMALTKRDWRGTEYLPPPGVGCVVIPNHISYFDPLAIAHFVYDSGRLPRFLVKSELFQIPVLGRVLLAAGQIPVYRRSVEASRAYREAVEAVDRGECVIVYPEGTFTSDPDLWPMVGKTGAARIALDTGCPVIPVGQWGAHEVLAPYTLRPHPLPRKTMHVWAGPAVRLDDLAGQPVGATVLRTATGRITAAVVAMLERIRGERAPVARFDPKTGSRSAVAEPVAPAPDADPAAEADTA
jgi:1-acyl-sn-glycerol-3-phosphate acyltransferase